MERELLVTVGVGCICALIAWDFCAPLSRPARALVAPVIVVVITYVAGLLLHWVGVVLGAH